MKDFRGREIKVGSLIAYPGRQGSSCWITVARVLDFGTTKKWSYSGEPKTAPTLVVQIVKSSDSYQKQRKTTIYAVERVVVITEE